MISLEFLLTSLIVVLIPGTGVVFTVSTGLAQGRRASVHAALGCGAGSPQCLPASARNWRPPNADAEPVKLHSRIGIGFAQLAAAPAMKAGTLDASSGRAPCEPGPAG